MKKILLLPYFAIVLSACDAPVQVYDGDPLSVLEKGSWDFDVTDKTCEAVQHTFDFSSKENGFTMHFINQDTQEVSKVNYEIKGVEGSILFTDMEGEDRKDDNGNLVSWYLIVNDNNNYCWRRSDWGPNSCTKPLVRCTT